MAAQGGAPSEATPAQEDSAALDNPFVVLETEQLASGGGSEGPSPPAALQTTESSRPPPAYTEALRRPINRGSSTPVEVSALLSRHPSVSTVTEREPSDGEHVRQQRGMTRAILLWLGIGQWYSGLCIFFSFLFFSGGSVLMVLSWLTLHKLMPVKLTVVAAGFVFVLLSLLWPCGWLWNQWNKTCGCSYAPFVSYVWALSLVYTAIVGALVFGVYEHYDCIHLCKNCTFYEDQKQPANEPYPCQFVQASLWTLVIMGSLMMTVVFVGFCYCCCNSSCRRRRNGYDTL